jgi:hypothetical protein
LPGSLSESEVKDAVDTALAPYQENNMGDCPKQYLEFNDVTDEYSKKYAESEEHRREYSTLDDFIAKYAGYKKDETTGRYGYWENPNKKWDWWAIGGRWSGYFPVKAEGAVRLGKKSWTMGDEEPEAGHADFTRKRDIDWDLVATKTREAIEKFHNGWEQVIAGKRLDAFDGPEATARRIGLLETRQGPPLPGEEDRAIPWATLVSPGDDRAGWHYIWTRVSLGDLFGKYADSFSPIAGYAYLDESGWHEPGEMSWFGFSSDTPETLLAHKQSFTQWLKATPDDAWLVAVDCHI